MELENKIKALVERDDHTNFIYDFLLLYNFPKATITRLQKNNDDLLKKSNQIIVKKKLFFEIVSERDNVMSVITQLDQAEDTHKWSPRFLIVTNFNDIAFKDTKTGEQKIVHFKDLWKETDFFLPWTGKEKYQIHLENPADVRAAEKMAKIYDEIYHNNKNFAEEYNHELNIFLARLLFCFFAEDTGIFPGENKFTEAMNNHTKEDGSDLKQFLEIFFASLDEKDKTKYPQYMQDFPYVNGRLFRDRTRIPELTAKVRELILECGDQNNWKEINPDIFGSMFQAVKTEKVRSGLGQHYTSVPNIMKVINPLFMDELREEFEKSYDNVNKLKSLQLRLSKIRVFDPACGSGNFLIIAYKQMKLLEMDIIKRIQEVSGEKDFQMNLSVIELRQFYGIEIDDFACEIARLSLWLAEHQMNCKFKEEFGVTRPTLPLCESGHIVCGNALRVNWEDVCPKYIEKSNLTRVVAEADLKNTPLHLSTPKEQAEVYILGNPPYEGARKQSPEQKIDLNIVYHGGEEYKDADYITAWFIKATSYVRDTPFSFAFVSTQSITQGEQIGILWPRIFSQDMEIFFAYQAFRWSNNAKKNAGVVCVIIGIKKRSTQMKSLYKDGLCENVKNISPYLTSKESIVVAARKTPISQLPKMILGNMARDGGNLILSTYEKNELLKQHPEANCYIRRLYGSREFIRGEERWCLWIEDKDIEKVKSIEFIRDRIQKVYNFRISSKAKTTNQYAKVSYRFAQCTDFKHSAIIVPSTSSERRQYIPMGFLDKSSMITNSALAIYDVSSWVLGILTSKMHMVWVTSVCGTLGTSTRYSAEICYNTFPFPKITDQQKKRIELCVQDILRVREKYSERTMAELYDPDKMPKDLLDAHHSLDLVIESCYRKKPFENDEQRLTHLFKMYEMMVNNASEEELKQLELGV